MKSGKARSGISSLAATGVITFVVLGLLLVLTRPGVLAQEPPSSSPTSPTGIEGVPETCPVTVPGDDAFAPVAEPPAGPPPLYESVWHGTPALWTMINPDGDEGHKRWLHGEKTFWWSEDFSLMDELEPGITVIAEHLDGSASTVEAGGPGTNGSHADLGDFMLVGVEIPEPGCWRVTADYRDASLSYVVWIAND